MVIGLIGFLAYRLLVHPPWTLRGATWRGASLVIASAVVGKLLGLGYAQVRIWQLRSALKGTAVPSD